MKTAKERIFWGALLVFSISGLYVFLALNGLAYNKSFTLTPQAHITLIPGPVIPTPDLGLLTSITPTATLDPASPNSNGIQTGSYVQITGTEGSGLNIRNSPELNGIKNFVANESEVFLIIGGPISQDEYVWWQLSAPYDQSRQGWAVENYLHLIDP